MLKLIISGNDVRVWGRGSKEDVVIDQVTRFKVPNAEWSDKYKQGKWDGYDHLYSKRTGRFPLGLLNDVEMALMIEDIDYEIADTRNFIDLERLDLKGSWEHPIRDYQLEAMRRALKEKRGIISLPTGTGKTRVAEELINALKLPALFYVGRERLLKQTKKGFEETFDCKIGMVGDSVVDIRDITVATVQTVAKLPAAMFNQFPVRIMDECHHTAAKTIYDIARNGNSEYLIGLSATPQREDGMDMYINAGIGSIIYRKTTSEMIEAGYLAQPEIKVLTPSPMTFSKRDKYADVVQRYIVHNRERNELIATTAVQESLVGKVYIHVNRVDHGPILRDMINKRLLKREKERHAKWISGKTKTSEKDSVMEEFRNGDLKILVSTLLGEGVDVPEMYCLIMAAGGGKGRKVTVPQILGRVLRTGKHHIVKFYDCFDHANYLYDHFLERCRYYNSERAFDNDPIIEKFQRG